MTLPRALSEHGLPASLRWWLAAPAPSGLALPLWPPLLLSFSSLSCSGVFDVHSSLQACSSLSIFTRKAFCLVCSVIWYVHGFFFLFFFRKLFSNGVKVRPSLAIFSKTATHVPNHLSPQSLHSCFSPEHSLLYKSDIIYMSVLFALFIACSF